VGDDWFYSGLFLFGFELRDFLFGEGFGVPLVVVFGEDLDGGAADLFTGNEGVECASGDGHVGTD